MREPKKKNVSVCADRMEINILHEIKIQLIGVPGVVNYHSKLNSHFLFAFYNIR